jgi:hypothetical protein
VLQVLAVQEKILGHLGQVRRLQEFQVFMPAAAAAQQFKVFPYQALPAEVAAAARELV